MILGLVLPGVTTAHSEVEGTTPPTLPGTATAGDIFAASVLIINASTRDDKARARAASGMTLAHNHEDWCANYRETKFSGQD